MSHAETTSLIPSVKMFPRIAPKPHLRAAGFTPAGLAVATPHSRRRRRKPVPEGDELAARNEIHAQLRSRLLNMILDNERARRDAHRPTAG